MAAIATSKFRVHNAEQFVEQFTEASNTIMYMYIGGVKPFTDDFTPPTPQNDTANIEFVPWRDSIGAKRIQTTDVVHAIDRYDWTTGTTYDEYDDTDVNILDDDFYVLTDEYNVYKCLFNAGATASTTKPTGTSTSAFTTADGYIWKYMYTVTTSDALKFLTNDYLSVRTDSTVSAAAVDGGLNVIKLTAAGAGYTGTPIVTITGDGTGAAATCTLSGGAVSTITVTAQGSGYTTATVAFTANGSSSSAAARVIIPPKGGHGNNAIEELGGKFVMINVRLDGAESNTLSVANDFRKIGLIRDPHLYGTTIRATETNFRQTYRYYIPAATTSYSLDETVTVGSGSSANTATVVEWDNANKYLYTTKPLPLDFANSSSIVGANSGATGTITAINTPGLKAYSGDVLYIENRSPISRASDQIEDVKLIIEF